MTAISTRPASNSQVQTLLRLCRGDANVGASAEEIDWEVMVRLAAIHRLIPLFYSRLKQLDEGVVPPQVMSELRSSVQTNAARVLRLAGELRRLVSEFEKAKIPVIPFKGIVLAATVYGDVSLRDAGDLDLLVHYEDIVRAADLLTALGHKPFYPTATPRETSYLKSMKPAQRERYLRWHCEHHLVYEPTGLNVDLHWAMSLREYAVLLDIEGMWKRTRSANVAGQEMSMLAMEDLLLVLCLNGAKDCWQRMDRIVDVAQLLQREPQLNWPQVCAHAQRSGTGRMLRVGLSLASELMGVGLSEQIRDYIARDAKAAAMAGAIGRQLDTLCPLEEPTRFERAKFDMKMRERWRDRHRYIVGHLRPGVGDWAAVPLPGPLRFLHWLIRPFRLLTRHFLDQRKAVASDN